jgi:hypothetical protein
VSALSQSPPPPKDSAKAGDKKPTKAPEKEREKGKAEAPVEKEAPPAQPAGTWVLYCGVVVAV